MNDDWPEEEKPSLLPAVVEVPSELVVRLEKLEKCWTRLTPQQKLFLAAYRENNFNARKTARKLKNAVRREAHVRWMHDRNYALVVKLWRAAAGEEALDRDRLLVRQDDIVETLLTPKPVLFQGVPVRDIRDPLGLAVLEEVDASGASRANEVLMKAAGMLKEKDVDVNIGVIGPQFIIQVVQKDGTVRDATPRGVTVDLPETDWLDGV